MSFASSQTENPSSVVAPQKFAWLAQLQTAPLNAKIRDMSVFPDHPSGRRPLLDNHQRCWIWGKNTVLETLQAGHWTIWELHYDEALPDSMQEMLHRQAKGITTLVPSTSRSLEKLCKSSEHQGLIAKMAPFPYASLQDLEALTAPEKNACSILLLDRIQDPFNFGGMIRSAAGMGATAILIGQQSQTGVNSLVARSSSGIVNRIPIIRTTSLLETAEQLKSEGLSVFGTSGHHQSVSLTDVHFPSRHVIMIGSEAHGLDSQLLELADQTIQIPLSSGVESLNAAVAAGILCYEVFRQRIHAAAPGETLKD